MTKLMCLFLLALSTCAVGLQTNNLRGAGSHSQFFGLHEAQPESPEVAQETLEAEQEMMEPDAATRGEGQINMTENDMDMLTDRTGNDLYDLPDSLTDITMADEPNPSAKGKTFLTADRIQKLMAQAQADIKADKDLVNEGSSGLFMGYSKNRDLVVESEQYHNMSRPIVDADGSYRIIETPYEPFAGRDPNALQKDLKAIAERKAAEQKAAEKKAAREKAAKDKANQTKTATDDEDKAADDAEKETDDDTQEASGGEKEEKGEEEEADEDMKEATANEEDAPENKAQKERATNDEEETADDAEEDTADDAQQASEKEATANEEDAPENEAQTERAANDEEETADDAEEDTADDTQEASEEETEDSMEEGTAEEEDAPQVLAADEEESEEVPETEGEWE